MSNTLLAQIARNFFALHRVYQYRGKKVEEMDGPTVIRYCHFYCEENRLTDEFRQYREKVEAAYPYCPYLCENIDEGLCYDLQMIRYRCLKASALPDIPIDRETLEKCCADCCYQL